MATLVKHVYAILLQFGFHAAQPSSPYMSDFLSSLKGLYDITMAVLKRGYLVFRVWLIYRLDIALLEVTLETGMLDSVDLVARC